MKQTLLIYIFLIIMFALIGCRRDYEVEHYEVEPKISLMRIEDYQISVTEIENPGVYAVSVRVVGFLADGCHSYHETNYAEPNLRVHTAYGHIRPNYFDGDTITIEITQAESSGICVASVRYYIPVIFLGYFEKGSYKLIVNKYYGEFTVG